VKKANLSDLSDPFPSVNDKKVEVSKNGTLLHSELTNVRN